MLSAINGSTKDASIAAAQIAALIAISFFFSDFFKALRCSEVGNIHGVNNDSRRNNQQATARDYGYK